MTLQSFLLGFIGFINSVLIPFLLAVALAAFVFNIVKYFIIDGGSEKKDEAKQYALYSILGFVIITTIWGIVNLLIGGIGLDRSTAICPDYIPAIVCRNRPTESGHTSSLPPSTAEDTDEPTVDIPTDTPPSVPIEIPTTTPSSTSPTHPDYDTPWSPDAEVIPTSTEDCVGTSEECDPDYTPVPVYHTPSRFREYFFTVYPSASEEDFQRQLAIYTDEIGDYEYREFEDVDIDAILEEYDADAVLFIVEPLPEGSAEYADPRAARLNMCGGRGEPSDEGLFPFEGTLVDEPEYPFAMCVISLDPIR